MTDDRVAVLDDIVDDLRRVLAKCDEAGLCPVPAIYVDLAIQLALRERSPKLVGAK